MSTPAKLIRKAPGRALLKPYSLCRVLSILVQEAPTDHFFLPPLAHPEAASELSLYPLPQDPRLSNSSYTPAFQQHRPRANTFQTPNPSQTPFSSTRSQIRKVQPCDSPAAVVLKSSPWLAASLPSYALGLLAPALLGRTLSGNFMTSESSWQKALPGRPLVPAPPTVLGPGLKLGLSSCRGVSIGPGARVPDPLPACRGIPPHPTIQPLPGTLVSGECGRRGAGKGSPTNDPTSSFLVRAQSQF